MHIQLGNSANNSPRDLEPRRVAFERQWNSRKRIPFQPNVFSDRTGCSASSDLRCGILLSAAAPDRAPGESSQTYHILPKMYRAFPLD
jgi:hypothetical protein